MSNEVRRPDLRTIPINSTPDNFKQLVGRMVTPDDTRVLGPKGSELINDTLLNLSVFAPAPATFDRLAFTIVAVPVVEGKELSAIQADYLLEIAKQTKVISERADGRLVLDPEAQLRLNMIYEQS